MVDRRKAEREKNERIRLALESLKVAENNRDIGLWVTRDGVDLFSDILGNSVRRIVREEVSNAFKDLFMGMLEGSLNELEDDLPNVEEMLKNEEKHFEDQEDDDWGTPPIKPLDQVINDMQQKEQDPIQEKKERTAKLWSEEDDKFLMDLMNDPDRQHLSVTGNLRLAALKLNRSFSAVRIRYYTLKNAAENAQD